VLKLNKDMKVVCVCRGGQVRSVCTRYLLSDRFGFRKVLACGWEKNDQETVDMLCEWADVVLLLRDASECVPLCPRLDQKLVTVFIGLDVWGRYNHPDLVNKLLPIVEALVDEKR
jgi:hypothetical protein